ncbi:MAG: hypothetical protein ABI623_03930, partial [bacterium]
MSGKTFFSLVVKSNILIAILLSGFNISQSQQPKGSYPVMGMPGRNGGDNSTAIVQVRPTYDGPPSSSTKWQRSATPLIVASTFVVSTTNDTGSGSLRTAIDSANASPGLDMINFSISGTITPHSPLPEITGPVIINGTYPPVIELNGSQAGVNANGLVLKGGNSIVRGLVINRFGGIAGNGYGFGIILDVNGGNVIEGNYIGTNVAGTAVLPNSANGVAIFGTSTGNRVGGTT